MKILITGATGFIGSHLVSVLLEAGHEVAVTKRKTARAENITVGVQVIDSENYDTIYSGIKNFTPGIVIHLAAEYVNKHEPEQIAGLINSNITFGTWILEAMITNNIEQFINIGTRFQHLRNSSYCPVNLYAATKEAFKNILTFYESRGIIHKTIELSDTYGEGDTRKKIMELLITACRNKEPLDLTPGEQLLDLASVDDICDFLMSHIDKPDFFNNKTITLSGNVIKLRDLGNMIEQRFNTQGILRWGARPYRENEIMAPPQYYPEIKLNQDSLEKYINKLVCERP
jgi:nucleoside-diphosphate-sugar epimerase